jgi:CheY-like chemotaxis protein
MRSLRPDLPVILCTGFNPTGVYLDGAATRVLEKPIDPIELGRVVRDLLDLRVPA